MNISSTNNHSFSIQSLLPQICFPNPFLYLPHLTLKPSRKSKPLFLYEKSQQRDVWGAYGHFHGPLKWLPTVEVKYSYGPKQPLHFRYETGPREFMAYHTCRGQEQEWCGICAEYFFFAVIIIFFRRKISRRFGWMMLLDLFACKAVNFCPGHLLCSHNVFVAVKEWYNERWRWWCRRNSNIYCSECCSFR